MAETIDIVRLDAAGNVVETLVDHVPAGWSAARTELGKLRHGEAGTQAAAEGGWLELRVGGVAKMSTKTAALEPKKRRPARSRRSRRRRKAARAPAVDEPVGRREAAPRCGARLRLRRRLARRPRA